jgi:rhomboid protease GluP
VFIQTGIPPLFARLTPERAHTYSIVLASAGIPHAVHPDGSLRTIHVPREWRAEARKAVSLYLSENPAELRSPVRPREPRGRTASALFAVLIAAAVHWAVGSGAGRDAIIAAMGADAEKIVQGEWYRIITALLLHGDGAHLLANMAAGLLFGTYAALMYGWGLGWLLIVLTGAQGNLLTAWWYGHSHMSVGASTAVFGALGLCASGAFWQRRRDHSGRLRPWVSVAGALALVGWLGTSPRADLAAHLFGFASGLLYGFLFSKWSGGRILPWVYQAACLVIVAVLVAGSLWWGLHQSG